MRARTPVLAFLLACVLAGTACDQHATTHPISATTASGRVAPAAAAPETSRRQNAVRDLSIDESLGGHTLSRHVGRTDADLRERLRREREISAASTYTDRGTAERVVGATLASGGRKLESWETRSGRRPNLVLDYAGKADEIVGRSLTRGQQSAKPCYHALIVLRWDERADRFYVLTSYPEERR